MSIIEVKNRIKAVKNIGQITKAMEVVAATKMRKSQQVALNSRPYAFKALQLLSVLSQQEKVKTALMEPREVKKTLLVIVTSDRGLAGSFNSQVLRLADSTLFPRSLASGTPEARLLGKTSEKVIAIGKKAIAYAHKKKLNLAGQFSGFGDFVEPSETSPLADVLIDGFIASRSKASGSDRSQASWDRVMTISTHFRTTLKQEVIMRQILPVELEKIKQTINEIIPEHGKFSDLKEIGRHRKSTNLGTDYIFEPSPKELIDGLVDHLVRMQIYHIVLEANASEHSARMVAMKTASDNAKDLLVKLNLEYNKARQANITRELIEITAGKNVIDI